MILDHIDHLPRYALPYKDKIIAFLKAQDPKTVPDGEHEIDGRNLFVRVMSYEPKPAAENKFEAHRIYADLQYVADGVELMQVVSSDRLTPITEYLPEKEYQFFSAEKDITDLVVRTGEFTIFYPGEAHKPSCRHESNVGIVKKLVFKIKMGA